ncbi:Helicase associated domain protein [Vibrio crassostreae]|uniref:Helicase associated domain protein n=1 Tax=Vibrio crassostreae TaxID=246167 RepID=UPI001B3023A3
MFTEQRKLHKCVKQHLISKDFKIETLKECSGFSIYRKQGSFDSSHLSAVIDSTYKELDYSIALDALKEMEAISPTGSYELYTDGHVDPKCFELERFNMAIWTKIPTQQQLELKGHNKDTYRKLEKAFREGVNKTSIVQATGTGKRYLIGQFLLDHVSERTLFLSPSNYINDQQIKLTPNASVEVMTYQAILAQYKLGELPSGFDFIVMDEFHRSGANTWSLAIEELIALNPNAKLLGLTATPSREGGTIDMRDHWFDGHCVSEIELGEAIARGILPAPKYVKALTQPLKELNCAIEKAEATIGVSKNELEKLKSQAKKAAINWKSALSVDSILSRNLDDLSGKYLVFFESKEHMEKMSPVVQKWFKDAIKGSSQPNLKVTAKSVVGEMPKKDIKVELDEFSKECPSDEVRLMFSINLLNEGLHISGVERVILLRETQSINVYLQQIGRCLSADLSMNPIIFDFVNNIDAVGLFDFGDVFNEFMDTESGVRSKAGLPSKTKQLLVEDYVEHVSELLEKFSALTNPWMYGLTAFRAFLENNGHGNVSSNHITKTGFNLGKWVSTNRSDNKRGRMKAEREQRLTESGFLFDKAEYEWQEGIDHLKDFIEEFGHANPARDTVTTNGFKLGIWLANRRANNKKGLLTGKQVKTLEELGVAWDRLTQVWLEGLGRFKVFVEEHGHSDIKRSYKTECGFSLGSWVNNKRNEKKAQKLPAERIKALEAVGIIWDKKSAATS